MEDGGIINVEYLMAGNPGMWCDKGVWDWP